MKSFPIETWFRSISIDSIKSFLGNRLFRKISLGFVSLFIIYFGIMRYLEYRIFDSRIQVNDIRNFITQVINDDLSKAVDLGIIEFSIWEGILIEDLMISQEEDFTYNRKLLQSKKIGLKLSSLFSKQPYIKKIKIIEPMIHIDTGDDFFSSLVDYLLKANFQEVEFSGLQIEVYDAENQILNLQQKSDWVFYKKEDTIEFRFSNGWFWLPFVTRIQGNGSIQLKEGKPANVEMNTRWKNLDIKEVSGFASWIHLFNSDEGSTSGSLKFQYSEFSQNLYTETEWKAMNGNFIFFPKVIWEDIDFQNKFTYTKDIPSQTKTYKRTYSNNWGDWSYSIENTKDLESSKIDWNFPDMEDLFESLSVAKETNVNGSFQGSLDWKETGTRNNWFILNGKFTWQDGKWQDTELDLNWDKWETQIIENQLLSKGSGQVFSSRFNLDANAKLQFWKSIRPDKSNYYPLGMNGSIQTKLDTLQLENWYNLKSSIQTYIQKEIKDRQEKILPEEYFTQQKIYKYLLEEMNLTWNGSIQKVIIQDNASESLDWNHSVIIQAGRITAKASQKNTSNSISFNSQFATKSPYMEMNLNLVDFSWKKPLFNLCGYSVLPESLDLEYRFRSSGADFNSITKQGNHTSIWNLKKAKIMNATEEFEKENINSNFPIPAWDKKESFDLGFEMDHYFENTYFRNITLVSSSGNEWKGFGSTKNNLPYYTLYGKVGTEFKTIQLLEEEDICK